MKLVSHRLCKSYGTVKAVDDVSFSLESGTITAFLGTNGAGKTTVIRMILGLLKRDFGEVFVSSLGQEIQNCSTGAVLDNPAFFPSLTGRENLEKLASLARDFIPESESVKKCVERSLLRTNLTDVADKKVSTYSTGMMKRLAIAWAIVFKRDVLILDEPFEGLDPQSRMLLRKIIRESASEGTAVIVSSHQLGEIDELASHVLFLRRGRVVFSGEPQSIFKEKLTRIQVKSNVTKESSRDRKELVTSILTESMIPCFNDSGFTAEVHYDEIPEILHRLCDKQIKIYSLVPLKKTLEDLFISLQNMDLGIPDEISATGSEKDNNPIDPPDKGTHPCDKTSFLDTLKFEFFRLNRSRSFNGLMVLPSLLLILLIPLLLLSPWVFAGFRAKYMIPAVSGCMTLSLSFGRYLFPLTMAIILCELFASQFQRGTIDTMFLSGVSRFKLFAAKSTAAFIWTGISILFLPLFYGIDLFLAWLFLDQSWWTAYNLPLDSIAASGILILGFYFIAQTVFLGYWTFFSVISDGFGKAVTKGLVPLFVMAITGSLSHEICAMLGISVNPALIFFTTQYSKIGDFDLLDSIFNHGIAPWPPFFLRDIVLLGVEGIAFLAFGAIIFGKRDFNGGKS